MFFKAFFDAGWVIRFVMMSLLCASVFSWMVILSKHALHKSARRSISFWSETLGSGRPVDQIYGEAIELSDQGDPIAGVFCALANAGVRSIGRNGMKKIADHYMHMYFRFLQDRVASLAVISSSATLVGLFGTVWGIMSTLHTIGGMQNMTIAAIAPGMSEALFATALGLIVAIPASVAYNMLTESSVVISEDMERLVEQSLTYVEERKSSGN